MLPEVRGFGMRCDEDVARCALDKRKAALEVVGTRIGFSATEQEAIGRYGCQAIGINEVQTVAVFARAPGPARATRRVTGCEMCGDGNCAGAQVLTIFDGLYSRDSGDGSEGAKLRVVARHRTFVHDVRGPLACGNTGPAEPLQCGHSAGVIEMGVRVYDELDVFDAKSQRADVGNDQRRRLGQRAVDEDMASLGGDQDGAQALSADVVGIAVDPEWLVRFVPGGTIGAGRMHILSGNRNSQHEEQKVSTAHVTIVIQIGRASCRERCRSRWSPYH